MGQQNAERVVVVGLAGAVWEAVALLEAGPLADAVVGEVRRAGGACDAVSERVAVRLGAMPWRGVRAQRLPACAGECANCGEVRTDVRPYGGEAWCRACAEAGVRFAHVHVHDAEDAAGCEECAAGFAAVDAAWASGGGGR